MKDSLIWLATAFGLGLIGCGQQETEDGSAGGAAGAPSATAGASGAANGSGGSGGEANPHAEQDCSQNVTLFDGEGVDLDSCNLASLEGRFRIIQDSVVGGELIEDGRTHTQLLADSGGKQTPVPRFSDASTGACVSGRLAQIVSLEGETCDPRGAGVLCDFEGLWGGGLEIPLSPNDGEVFDATAAGVIGVSYELSGSATGEEETWEPALYLVARDARNPDEYFCAHAYLGSSEEVAFEDMRHFCFGSDGTLTLDPTQLTSLRFELRTSPITAFDVENLCIERLELLVE